MKLAHNRAVRPFPFAHGFLLQLRHSGREPSCNIAFAINLFEISDLHSKSTSSTRFRRKRTTSCAILLDCWLPNFDVVGIRERKVPAVPTALSRKAEGARPERSPERSRMGVPRPWGPGRGRLPKTPQKL